MDHISADEIAMRMTMDVSGYMSGIDKAMSATNQIGSSLTGSLSKAKGDFASIGKSIGNDLATNIGASFGPLGNAAAGLATALGPVGIAAGAVGVALGGVVSSSVGVASSFQTAMSGVNAVLGGTTEDLATLSAAAREAGATTSFSATQAAQALNALASAGYTVDQSTSALTSTLNLAGAGGMELERAAQMLTTDLSVFSLGAENAGRLTDILATAANKSNSGVAEMGDALARVGGTANALGINLEQTTAVLETMSNGGIKATEAGTKLNAILGQLTVASSSGATQKQKDAMAEMGITAEQLNPTLNTQSEIFTLLNEKHMTGAQSLALFGLENNAAASYIAANAEKIGEYESQLTSCDGAAAAMSATMKDNLKGAMDEMSSAMEEAQISIGNLFLPALTSIVQGTTAVISAATNVGKAFAEIVTNSTAFQAIGAAASAVGSAIKTSFGNIAAIISPVWNVLGEGNTVLALLQAGFNLLTTPITMVTSGIKAAASAFGALNSALTPVASAIGGALASGIKAIGSDLTTASAYAQAFGEAIADLVSKSSTVQAISSAFESVKSTISGIGSAIGDIASKIVSGLTEAIPKAISGFIGAIQDLFGQAGTAASETFTDVIKDSPLGGLLGFAEGISARANEILGTGKEVGNTMGEGVKNSEDLAKAPGDALSSDQAMSGVEDAGKDAGEKYADEMAAAISRQGAGVSLALAKVMEQAIAENGVYVNSPMGDDRSNKDWSDYVSRYETKIDSATITSVWTPDGNGGRYSIYQVDDNGKKILLAEKYFRIGQYKSAEACVQELLATTGFKFDQGNVYDLTGSSTKAAVWRQKIDIEPIFDTTGAKAAISKYSAELGNELDAMTANLERYMNSIDDQAVFDQIKTSYQSLLDLLAQPVSLENFGLLQTLEQDANLGAWGEKQMAAYKEALDAGIADAGVFVKSEMTRIGEDANSAFSDGFVSDSEKSELLGLKPQLEYLKQVCPEQFKEMGGESIEAMIAALEAGDVKGAMAIMGKEAGEAFKANVVGGAELAVKSLAEIINDPELLNGAVEDPFRFYSGTILPAIEEMIEKGDELLASGQYNATEIFQNYVSQIEKIYGYVPTYISKLTQAFAAGNMSWPQYTAAVSAYNDAILDAMTATNGQTQSVNSLSSSCSSATGNVNAVTNSIYRSGSATQQGTTFMDAYGNSVDRVSQASIPALSNSAVHATGTLQDMGLAIQPLNEISGKGIAVTFKPAEVIADKAAAQLTDAATLFKEKVAGVVGFFASAMGNITPVGRTGSTINDYANQQTKDAQANKVTQQKPIQNYGTGTYQQYIDQTAAALLRPGQTQTVKLDAAQEEDWLKGICEVGPDGMRTGLAEDLASAGIWKPVATQTSQDIQAALNPNLSAYAISIETQTANGNDFAVSCLQNTELMEEAATNTQDATTRSVSSLGGFGDYVEQAAVKGTTSTGKFSDSILGTLQPISSHSSAVSESAIKLHTMSVESDYLSDSQTDLTLTTTQLDQGLTRCALSANGLTSCLESVDNMYTEKVTGGIGPKEANTVDSDLARDKDPGWFTNALGTTKDTLVDGAKDSAKIQVAAANDSGKVFARDVSASSEMYARQAASASTQLTSAVLTASGTMQQAAAAIGVSAVKMNETSSAISAMQLGTATSIANQQQAVAANTNSQQLMTSNTVNQQAIQTNNQIGAQQVNTSQLTGTIHREAVSLGAGVHKDAVVSGATFHKDTVSVSATEWGKGVSDSSGVWKVTIDTTSNAWSTVIGASSQAFYSSASAWFDSAGGLSGYSTTGPGGVHSDPSADVSSRVRGWLNEGASRVGGKGAIRFNAKGGIVDSPTMSIFGEAGREAFIPLDDKAAGWDILRQILPEFGIQPFADGGFAGLPRIPEASTVNVNINSQPSAKQQQTLVIVVDQNNNEIARTVMDTSSKKLKLKMGKKTR